MIIAMIKGATRVCGKAQGYLGLPVRDMVIIDKATGQETPAMHTAWTPTPDELDRLNKGANIIVSCLGTIPVPMMLTVDTEVPAQPTLEPGICYCRNQFEKSHCAYFKGGFCKRVT